MSHFEYPNFIFFERWHPERLDNPHMTLKWPQNHLLIAGLNLNTILKVLCKMGNRQLDHRTCIQPICSADSKPCSLIRIDYCVPIFLKVEKSFIVTSTLYELLIFKGYLMLLAVIAVLKYCALPARKNLIIISRVQRSYKWLRNVKKHFSESNIFQNSLETYSMPHTI